MVPFNHISNIQVNYVLNSSLNSDIFEIPFTNGDSLFIMLPKDMNGLNTILGNTTTYNDLGASLANATTRLVSTIVDDLFLPRFMFQTSYELSDSMKTLNVTALFDPTMADLSLITTKKPFALSKVVHEAVIELDETASDTSSFIIKSKGTKTVTTAPETTSLTLNANHPFLFFIRDNASRMLLFLGVINNAM